MYQSPIVAHGFNHQSLYRQPISNLRQIDEVVSNLNKETQKTGGIMPHAYSSIPNQQFVPQNGYVEKQLHSPLTDSNRVQINSDTATINNHVNGFSRYLPPTAKTGYPSTRQSRPVNMASGTNQDQLLPRQSSAGAISENRNFPSQETATLSNSRSAGAIDAYIQRERRAHTMAPLARISGPKSNITTSAFASTVAPADAQTMKSSHVTQTMHNSTLNSQSLSNAEVVDAIDDNQEDNTDDHGEEKEEEEEDNDNDDEEEEEEDDDAPIIVKVQYDPDTGGPPSEDIIRQAVENQLKGESRPKNGVDPIVLNFLKQPAQPRTPLMPIRPQQPIFNRSTPFIPQLTARPQHRFPNPPQQQQQQNLQSLQQGQYQQQLLLQQQKQQQFQLQEKQRQQRRQQELQWQLQKQKQQLEQYLQQQAQREQQQKQEQLQAEQYEIQQLIQQQLQLERQQQQFKHEQQRKQEQLQQLRRKLLAEQYEIQQLIQRQLQLERQQQQQQKHRELFQQQQRQRQRQQVLQQQTQQIYQPQQYKQTQQYTSLPPMGPRTSRTVSSIRTIPMNQSPAIFISNSHTYPRQSFSPTLISSRNPQQYSNITIQKLSNRNLNSSLGSNSMPTGLNAYNSYPYQHVSNTFIPIQVQGVVDQQFTSVNDNGILNSPQNLLQRPHTAPLSTAMFRPPSACDIPELSKENLSSMLDRIPDLRGRRFSIEYIEPTEPAGYPLPSLLDSANAAYPESVTVDQLPNNILQHIRNSGNLELKTALDLTDQVEENAQPTIQFPTRTSKLKTTSKKVLHHSARLRHRVKHIRPVSLNISVHSDSFNELFTSEEETKVQILSRSKYLNSN